MKINIYFSLMKKTIYMIEKRYKKLIIITVCYAHSGFSSVGRAFDCSGL